MPRKDKRGGVAFLYNPERVQIIPNKVNKSQSFEIFECVIKSSSQTVRLVVVYRTTQTKNKERYNAIKVSKFLDEFDSYFGSLRNKCGIPIICGDLNFHVNDAADSTAKQFLDLVKAHGFHQLVSEPTHIGGNTLDVLLKPKNIADSISVENITFDQLHETSSDHYLVHFELPISLSRCTQPIFEEHTFQEIDKIDLDAFLYYLKDSTLCKDSEFEKLSLDEAVSLFHNTAETLLNKHAPVISRKFKINKTPW